MLKDSKKISLNKPSKVGQCSLPFFEGISNRLFILENICYLKPKAWAQLPYKSPILCNLKRPGISSIWVEEFTLKVI